MLRPLSFLVLIGFSAAAQLPETDIWVFRLSENKEGKYIITRGVNASSRPGYDNQPCFSEDEKEIYFSAVHADGQADVYTLNSANHKIKKTTASPESEYSPQPIGPDRIACVVVEKDSSQKIHLIDLQQLNHQALPFDSVGYYIFVNTDTLVYYKLTSPHSLRFHVQSSGEDKFLCWSPIRGMKTINRHSFVYGTMDSGSVNYYLYDFLLRKARHLAWAATKSEDLFWHDDWGLLRSESSSILYLDGDKWQTLFDLSAFGIRSMSRFVIDSGKKHLVVVESK